MHNIVIKEIDVDFFMMYEKNALESARDELNYMCNSSDVGKWAKENGVKLTQQTYTKSSDQMHKVVLYATMTDIQRTEYALRFYNL